MGRDYTVVDSDAHVLEPPDLWTRYLEAKYRDQAPRVRPAETGGEVFFIENGNILDVRHQNQFGMANTGGIGMRNGTSPRGNSYTDGHPGGFDPHQRILVLDREGIDASFLYPTLGLLIGGMKNEQLATACCRAYNRWLADYCSSYPARLFGVALIPMQSPDEAIAEIRFVTSDLGLRAGFVRPNPYGGRPLHHPSNDPVWRVAQDCGLAIAVHATSSNIGMPVLAEDRFKGRKAAKHCVSHTLEMIAAVTSFVMCGICDRFPDLRVGFMEAGGGWLAGWLDRMDRHFEDKGMNDTGLSIHPSEIFRRQCFISFEPTEKLLPLVADYIGRRNILWATDFPHSDGFVDAPGMIRQLGLAPDLLESVMSSGAKRFYALG